VSAHLDELYLTWLYGHIANPEIANPSQSFWKLAKQLFTTEFLSFVPNDDNRVEDGRALRYEFIDDLGLEDVDPHWMAVGCSFLEMLIGLSRRLSFQDEGQPLEWFWHLLANLGLRYNDRVRETTMGYEIKEVTDRVVYRTYDSSGRGGLFPLIHPDADQRRVELWYQLNAYLQERN